jgi:hypothetical protein
VRVVVQERVFAVPATGEESLGAYRRALEIRGDIREFVCPQGVSEWSCCYGRMLTVESVADALEADCSVTRITLVVSIPLDVTG